MKPFLSSKHSHRYAIGLAIWALGWCALLALGTRLDLANLSLMLVLTSAIAALWLPLSATLAASAIALMAFNWAFVPPRGTFAIDLHQHAFLLLALLVVNVIVAGLMVSLREQTRRAHAHVSAADALRRWGDQLRDAKEPLTLCDELHQQLSHLSGFPVYVLIDCVAETASLSVEQREALDYCRETNQSLGPGTGRYQELTNVYLALRGKRQAWGAVMLDAQLAHEPERFVHAQALCDQMGWALEQQHILQLEQLARDQVQSQHLRNTFLAAISHDYRTPLATIMGAASSLLEQDERLTSEQRRQFAQRVVDEADRLGRQTNNMLQLARLDGIKAVGAAIHSDWESLEEIIGNVLQRIPDEFQNRIETHIQPDLPLVWGDALLLTQLLENLIDNALKYGPANGRITLIAQSTFRHLVLAVEDQGSGLSAQEFEQLLETFQRGDHRQSGAGVGLALCRAIVRVHGGELNHSNVNGSHFECRFPLKLQPSVPGVDQ
ncbi:MAG TPA: ATP-binding protein [Cellvibrio sp.]|nr:ATP-binding protein [Cellvibrio sp.]